jgi:hypothetical protein
LNIVCEGERKKERERERERERESARERARERERERERERFMFFLSGRERDSSVRVNLGKHQKKPTLVLVADKCTYICFFLIFFVRENAGKYRKVYADTSACCGQAYSYSRSYR